MRALGYPTRMIWPQAIACFAVWVGYGWWLKGRSGALRARMLRTPRRVRVLYGSVGLIGSAVGLLLGLSVIAAQGGLTPQGLTPWAWIATTLLGLGFVHMQTMGAAAMITLVQDESSRPRNASDPQRPATTEAPSTATASTTSPPNP